MLDDDYGGVAGPDDEPTKVTRIRYPVTRITYFENFLRQTNKSSVVFKRFS
jgi:hypothetical protein